MQKINPFERQPAMYPGGASFPLRPLWKDRHFGTSHCVVAQVANCIGHGHLILQRRLLCGEFELLPLQGDAACAEALYKMRNAFFRRTSSRWFAVNIQN